MTAALHSTSPAVQRVLAALSVRGCDPRREGDGYRAKCPCSTHGVHRGHNLAIDESRDGNVLVTCHSHDCAYADVMQALGLGQGDGFADAIHSNGHGPPRRDGAHLTAAHTVLLARSVERSTASPAAPRMIDEQIVRAMHERLMANATEMAWLAERRGIIRETVERYQLGHDGRRFFIPVRDADGRCVNIRRYDPNAQRAHNKMISWRSGFGGARLYPLAAIDAPGPLILCEGELDTLIAQQHGISAITTTGGAGTWREEWSALFAGRDVVIAYDHDTAGRTGAANVARALHGIAASVRIHTWPEEKPPGFDVTDWFLTGDTVAALRARLDQAPEYVPSANAIDDMASDTVEDFFAFLPTHSYIYRKTRDLWPAASVNARVPEWKVPPGSLEKASAWLDAHRAVVQLTWAPGELELIRDRLIDSNGGGWFAQPGASCFNLYRAPSPVDGNPDQAGPWLDHVFKLYGDNASHMIHWFAHYVQRPGEKINHALMLGGSPGIGKDTLFEPVTRAVGPWNVAEVSPRDLGDAFNPYVQSVLLRVSEVHDLGDTDRYAFYERMKTLTAAPPDVLRCNRKHMHPFAVPNVIGVILTSNHRLDGLYLPADDRRHFVAWSECTRADFPPEYFRDLYAWYATGGYGHVAAYLAALDISAFDPKAPPPKTPAFWAIVDANRPSEDTEFTDVIERLGRPTATTVARIAAVADAAFREWLLDRRNRRQLPHRLEAIGYVALRNDGSADGRWKIDRQNQTVYVRNELAVRDRHAAVRMLVEATR